MVPLPPEPSIERSGSITSNPLPYTVNDSGPFEIYDINPALPKAFSIRIDVNGVRGSELHYPEDNGNTIWQNGGDVIELSINPSDLSFIGFSVLQTLTITSFDCYIDGVKMNLTQ